MAVLFRREKEEPPSVVDPFTAPGVAAGVRRPAVVAPAATPAPPQAAGAEPTIQDIVQGRLVTAAFQPIVRLDSAEAVAFEAFARGPHGTRLGSPREMFAAAAQAGLAAELDQVAHAAAYRDALNAKLHPSLSLFVNADARQLGTAVPDDLQGVVALALARLRMLIEVSERILVAAPARAMAGIEKARASGWGIAWDNLGATPDALALMPFVRPDVVKIDVSLAHDGLRGHGGRVVSAVVAYAERSGASIMATNIESEAHLNTARGIGAILGQGYHFGRPGELPTNTKPPHQPITLITDYGPVDPQSTPFGIFQEARQPVAATRAMVEALANQLEQRAAIDPEPPVVIACLPQSQLLSGAPLAQLQLITRNAGFAAAVMCEAPGFDIPGVRVVQLAEDDPARDEWAIAVVGPTFAALLTARERSGRRDGEFAFLYGLTYDRPLVERAARALLHRITDADLTTTAG